MSALADILDAIVADHGAAAYVIAGQQVRAVKRKLPKKQERVDVAYQVTVSGAENVDRVRRIGFGQVYVVSYTVEMTLVTPNDNDALTNLDEHAQWRETTRARYMRPLASQAALAAIGVKQIEVVKGPFLDRSLYAEGYDYQQIVLDLTTYERRT